MAHYLDELTVDHDDIFADRLLDGSKPRLFEQLERRYVLERRYRTISYGLEAPHHEGCYVIPKTMPQARMDAELIIKYLSEVNNSHQNEQRLGAARQRLVDAGYMVASREQELLTQTVVRNHAIKAGYMDEDGNYIPD